MNLYSQSTPSCLSPSRISGYHPIPPVAPVSVDSKNPASFRPLKVGFYGFLGLCQARKRIWLKFGMQKSGERGDIQRTCRGPGPEWDIQRMDDSWNVHDNPEDHLHQTWCQHVNTAKKHSFWQRFSVIIIFILLKIEQVGVTFSSVRSKIDLVFQQWNHNEMESYN